MDLLCWLWEKDPGFRDKMPRKLLHVSYLERKTKDWVWSKIKFHVGSREPLLAKVKCWTWSWSLFPQIFKTKQTKSDDPLLLFTVACPDFAVRNSTIFFCFRKSGFQTSTCTHAAVKRRKFAWFEHVKRHDSLSKTILQDTLEDGRRLSRQGKCWTDNLKNWTYLPMPELLTIASRTKKWKRISDKSSHTPSPPPDGPNCWEALTWSEFLPYKSNENATKAHTFCFAYTVRLTKPENKEAQQILFLQRIGCNR